MRRLVSIMLTLTMVVGVISCTEDVPEKETKQTTSLTLSFQLATHNGGESMTKGNDNAAIFDDFYAAIMDGRLMTSDYELTFTDIHTGDSFQLNGSWNTKEAIAIQMGTYNISGCATATGTYVQDKCSITINCKNIVIDSDDAIISLQASYDCALIIFSDDSIESVVNHTNNLDIKLPHFDKYIYAFINDSICDITSTDSYLLVTRHNCSQYTIPTFTSTFDKGKYYVYDTTSKTSFFESGFVLSEMENGDSNIPLFKVFNIGHSSMSVNVLMPEDIIEQNHILKYSLLDLYTFNLNYKFGGNGCPKSWAHSINLPEDRYTNQIKESCTITLNNNTAWVLGEDGKPFYDEESGTYLQQLSIMVPGQPNVLMIGEYQYGDSAYDSDRTNGYYQPLFAEDEYNVAWEQDHNVASNQVPWWYGFAVQELVTNTPPKPFEGKVDFEVILSEDNNNTKAKVRFTPSEEVEQYCVWVITESMRQEVLPFLNNDEKYMQWFITSESGFNEGALGMTGAKEMWMGQDPSGQGNCFYFIDGALTNSKNVFYAYIVAMGGGDKDGDGICDATLQTFERHEFKLGTPKLNTPKVDVTVLESTPDKVRYHVKKSEDSSQIKQAYYIANCEREWLGTDLSIDLLFAYYGNPLSDEDVAMINTDEGLIIEIPTKPAYPYFAMKLYNGEGYYSFTDIYNYILE